MEYNVFEETIEWIWQAKLTTLYWIKHDDYEVSSRFYCNKILKKLFKVNIFKKPLVLFFRKPLDFQCHVLYKHFTVLFSHGQTVAVLHSKREHVRSYSLYSKHLTRTQFCTRTNITHIAIPLSLCKYTLFFKSEDRLFLQPVHLRSTTTIGTQRTRRLFSSRKSRTNGKLP